MNDKYSYTKYQTIPVEVAIKWEDLYDVTRFKFVSDDEFYFNEIRIEKFAPPSLGELYIQTNNYRLTVAQCDHPYDNPKLILHQKNYHNYKIEVSAKDVYSQTQLDTINLNYQQEDLIFGIIPRYNFDEQYDWTVLEPNGLFLIRSVRLNYDWTYITAPRFYFKNNRD